MTTALDLIKRAMRIAQVYQIGEEPSADEAADCLTALNAMLSSWSNEKLMIPVSIIETLQMVAAQSVYTIGPTGDLVTTRPMSLGDGSYITYQDITYPLEIIDATQYSSIPYKAQTSIIPVYAWFSPTYQNSELTIWPVPTSADVDLVLEMWCALTSFATLSTVVSLPPGYEDTIAYNLAVRIAPEFNASISPVAVSMANSTKRSIKRQNTRVPVLTVPFEVLGGGLWWRNQC